MIIKELTNIPQQPTDEEPYKYVAVFTELELKILRSILGSCTNSRVRATWSTTSETNKPRSRMFEEMADIVERHEDIRTG